MYYLCNLVIPTCSCRICRRLTKICYRSVDREFFVYYNKMTIMHIRGANIAAPDVASEKGILNIKDATSMAYSCFETKLRGHKNSFERLF